MNSERYEFDQTHHLNESLGLLFKLVTRLISYQFYLRLIKSSPKSMEGAQQNAKVRVPVSQFAAQFSTKKEVWDFLTQGCGAYCPAKGTCTIWHLRDLANGSKRYIKAADIQLLYVPQYDSLTLEKMVEWASQRHPLVLGEYFPIKRELMKFPRQVSSRF